MSRFTLITGFQYQFSPGFVFLLCDLKDKHVCIFMSRCRQQSLSADDDALTLDKCEEIFNTLQEDYYEEFKVIDKELYFG